MKKSTIVIACVSLVVVLAGISFFWINSSEGTYVKKELTQQQAINAMPYIAITDEDYLLIQAIRQDDDIQKALKDGQASEYIIKKGENMAREMLPEDIQPSTVHSGYVFSIGFGTIYIDYAYKGHRIIISLLENGATAKTVARLPKIGQVKAIYTNSDNKEYQRSDWVPQFWFDIWGN